MSSSKDDVDDMAFLAYPRQGASGYLLGNQGNGGSGPSWGTQNRQKQLDEIKRIEQRTLDSSKVSIGILHETERVGLTTAEELTRQREQLDRTEDKLDSMNTSMRTSQKHINGMKSMFYGIKNYFSKGPETIPPGTQSSSSISGSKNSSSTLSSTMNSLNTHAENQVRSGNHPALAHRGIRGSSSTDNFFDDSSASKSTLSQRSAAVDRQLDQNLTEIGGGIERLKSLALGLGSEIDDQQDLLERITTKTERAQDTVKYQNRQLKQLLK